MSSSQQLILFLFSTLLGISTIVVIGGCGDWFDVQDTTIIMDNYRCEDATKKARSICKTFCTGRVQYNGRGLVHQLPWPEHENKNQGRTLKKIQLPDGFCSSGTVIAAEDGHSVSFYSKVAPHDNTRISIIRRTEDSIVVVDDDEKNLCRSHTTDRDIASFERKMTVDLSRIEQMIPSKEGALGMALAMLFVHLVVEEQVIPRITGASVCPDNEMSDTGHHVTEDIISECVTEVVTSKRKLCRLPTDHMKVASRKAILVRDNRENQLLSLLVRFDNLRDHWGCFSSDEMSSGSSITSSSFRLQRGPSKEYEDGREVEISNSKQPQHKSDLILAIFIHDQIMNHQDFTWPRLNEAAAFLNRFRLTSFT